MTISTREGEPVTITLSDLQITPAGPYVDAGTPASHWEASMDDDCLLYTSPSPRDGLLSRMPSSA